MTTNVSTIRQASVVLGRTHLLEFECRQCGAEDPTAQVTSIQEELADSRHDEELSACANLPFVCKTIENVVVSRLNIYMAQKSILGPLQSPHRKHHRVEITYYRRKIR